MSEARKDIVAGARASIGRGSHSFAAASRLFAPQTRERAWLLYCWCRAADDLTDGQEAGHGAAASGRAEDRQARLEALTATALDSDKPVPLPFAALRILAREVDLPRAWIADLLEGFALDSRGWRPESTDDLLRYCYHVAGSVGRMMAVVMGVPREDADTIDRACDLGIAFQLANIARDIVPDAEAGRVYLPAQWLAEAELSVDAIARPENRDRVAELAARLVRMARDYRASAQVGAARLPVRSRLAVLAAEAIYGEIGERVIRKGPAAWDSRIRIIASRKLALVALAAARSTRRVAGTPREGLWTAPA